MIPKFKAAMFDMDGTLLRSMRYWRLTAIELLLGRNIFPDPEQMARVFTTSSRLLCEEILKEHGIELDRWQILRELESYMHPHYLKDVTAKPRVGEYLERLKRAGVRMCIGTNAPMESARAALTRLGLIDYFEFITDQYEQKMSKNNPDYFRNVAARMGVDLKDMCVFEDALYSIRTAKELGCPVIGIRDQTYIQDQDEIKRLADHYICEYEELLDM